MAVFKYSAFVLCEGGSAHFKKTMESLRRLIGAEDLDIACLFDRKHYEIDPEVLHLIREAEDDSVTYFINASNAPNINKYFQSRESQVFFFLQEGDAADPYYLMHLENFFRKNSGVCSVAFVPVKNEGVDLSLASRQSASDSELAPVKEDEFIPFDASYGVALWAQGVRDAGLNLDPSAGGLKTMLDEMLKRLIQPKGVYGLIHAVCHSRMKDSSATAMDIAEEQKFWVSCIVPLYNAEKTLREAIDSVIDQSLDFAKNVQLILVNDGSTDASNEICGEYKEKYPENIFIIEQDNAGVSAARNAGLDAADGEYIAFLDSDDIYEEKFLEKGVAFLEQYAEEIDFVAFPLDLFGKIHEGQIHPLDYKFIESGIIDVTEHPDFLQFHAASTVIRQEAIGGARFREELSYGEDVEFLHRLLMPKMRYGVSLDSRLNYRKRDDSRVAGSLRSPEWYDKLRLLPPYLIEESLREHHEATPYTQHCILYDLQWYAFAEVPPEIAGTVDLQALREVLPEILTSMDDDVILSDRFLTPWLKFYLLAGKYGKPAFDMRDGSFGLCLGSGRELFEPLPLTAWISCVEEYGGVVSVAGRYDFPDDERYTFTALYNGQKYTETRARIQNEYFLGEPIHTQKFFVINLPYADGAPDADIEFFVEISGYGLFPLSLLATEPSRLRDTPKAFVLGEKSIIFKSDKANVLRVTASSPDAIEGAIVRYVQQNYAKASARDAELLGEYVRTYTMMSKRRIWLFMDRISKAGDNAEHLFKYCTRLPDGIEKYFVIDENAEDADRLKSYGSVVFYGSNQHRLLHLFAEAFISSDFMAAQLYPFGSGRQAEIFMGLSKAKFIFLQHGVTKDDMSEHLSLWTKNVKLFVTASKQEQDSILDGKYGYSPNVVKLTGFPRFDALTDEAEKKPKRQIVFMPTWRKSLAEAANTVGHWAYSEKFKDSEFCSRINAVLTDERLAKTAKMYGYRLLFRPHTNLYVQAEDFTLGSFTMPPEDYPFSKLFAETALLITDYSSAAFDFAYTKKPVVYCQMDERPLGGGYFDYETMGLGEVVTQREDLTDLLTEYMKNGCTMDQKYRERVDGFFAFRDTDNCRRVYEAIMEIEGTDE
jgi:CDP-glycerol glycerophosphotransferase (TagB/SpsB family)/GT2 family glycosyltransferase